MAETGSFLDGLAKDDRAALADRWTVRHVPSGATIVAHDDEQSADAFFVLEGRARATVYSASGRAVAYRDIEAGGIFGELSAIDRRPRSASVVALEPATVASLTGTAFKDLVVARPGFAWHLMTHLAAQVRHMTERVYEFSTLVVRKRLIRELLRLASESGDKDAEAVISPVPTHFELAAKISTHREAVSREMSALARRKLVERRRGMLVLKDVGRLEELSQADD